MDFETFHEIAKNAASQQKMIQIEYSDKNGAITTRRTEPYEIKNGIYYGYSIDPGTTGDVGTRKFKVFHITQATILDEIFTPRWPVKIG